MCCAHQKPVFGIEKLTFLPIQFDQLVGTAVEIGDRASSMAHDKRRLGVAKVFDLEAHAAATILQFAAGTNALTRA